MQRSAIWASRTTGVSHEGRQFEYDLRFFATLVLQSRVKESRMGRVCFCRDYCDLVHAALQRAGDNLIFCAARTRNKPTRVAEGQ